jgi:hypothetical protein
MLRIDSPPFPPKEDRAEAGKDVESPAPRDRTPARRISRWFPVLAIAAVGIVVPLLWYRSGQLLVGSDFSFPFDPVGTLASLWHGWAQNAGSGGATTVNLLPIAWPYFALAALLESAAVPPNVAELLVFSLTFAMAGVSMWFLLRRWFGNSPATFAGAGIYMLNPFTLISWHDAAAIELIAYGIAPLILLLIEIAATSQRLRFWFWPAVAAVSVSLAAPGAVPPMIVGMVVVPTLALLVFRWRSYRKVLPSVARVRRLAGVAVVGVTVNTWWLLPATVGLAKGSIASGFSQLSLTTSSTDMTTPLSFFDLITGFGMWGWHGGYQGRPNFTFAASYGSITMRLIVLIPIVVVVLAVLRTTSASRSLHRMGLALFVGGIFLAAGFHEPFGLFTWAYRHVPGFIAFRSPWEDFAGIEWFGVTMLAAIALAPGDDRVLLPHDIRWWHSSHPASLLRSAWPYAVALIVAMVVIVHPLFGGMYENRGANGRLAYYTSMPPKYVQRFNSYLANKPRCEVFNPEMAYSSYVAYSWLQGGAQNFNSLFPCEVLTANSDPSTEGDQVANLLDQAILSGVAQTSLVRLLADIGVTDVLVANDFNFDLYNTGPTPGQLMAYFTNGDAFKQKNFGQWTDFIVPRSRTSGLAIANGVVVSPSLATVSPNSLGAFIDGIAQPGNGDTFVSPPSRIPRDLVSTNMQDVSVVDRANGCGPCIQMEVADEVLNDRTVTTKRTIPIPGSGWRSVAIERGPAANAGCDAVTKVSQSSPPHSYVAARPITIFGPPWPESGVELTSRGVIGDCVYSSAAIQSSLVRLSFSYFDRKGSAAAVALVQNGYVLKSEVLPSASTWQRTTVFSDSAAVGKPVQVILYTLGHSSAAAADNVFAEVSLAQSEAANLPLPHLVPIRSGNVNLAAKATLSPAGNGSYRVEHLKGSALVTTTTSFASGWVLDAKPLSSGSTPVRVDHIRVDGYANGWLVTGNGSYMLTLEYTPSHLILVGSCISGGAFLLIVAGALFSLRGSRTSVIG